MTLYNSCIELGKLPCAWKIGQWHYQLDLRAIMALDHSRLGLENEFLQNKSGRIFCVRRVYFTKSCQQIWGRVNQPFILFIRQISGETVRTMRGCFYLFHNFARQVALIQYSGRSKHAWAFGETVKKISKITYTDSRFSFFASPKLAVRAVAV